MRSSDPRAGARVALIAAALWAAVPARAQTPAQTNADMPDRVVSMNLCTDQLALALADPGQIVSLSHFATDPGMSVHWKQAEDYRANHGRAEEISILHPDLVLADTWSNPDTIRMLRTLGIRVEQLPPGTSLSEIRARITTMGRLLGHPGRAAAMLAQFDARLAAIEKPAPGLRAAIIGPSGYGYGPRTLEGQILAMAGFTNVVSGPGLDWGGRLPMEDLVMDRPDLVVVGGSQGETGTSRAQEVLAHPVLRDLPVVRGLRDASWTCGAPAMLNAVQDLAALGRRIEKEKLTQ
ncbi:ABC transporter substrate-binding protein [Thioclava atlantica]|uniref:ABC transporter substrate-binding protein n=1 Tax=Thioclava atlantica TaxID=1317124 RepID=UPI00138E0524|nr:ABC transporter substrate-binding protein [Thioclava atlantica]